MVIHDINHAARFSRRIIAIKDGCIVKDDIPTNVITEEVIKAVFGIKARIITLSGECNCFNTFCVPYGVL
jgi:iron complex transport system ATP-binding protein